jgi:hypothetical protein
MLTWTKIRRTLEALSWDTQKFIKTYESLGRPARGPKKPEAKLLKAGAEFDRTGDLAAFQRAVGTKSVQQTYSRLGRYQAYMKRPQASA